jgi:hypothetical protein
MGYPYSKQVKEEALINRNKILYVFAYAYLF